MLKVVDKTYSNTTVDRKKIENYLETVLCNSELGFLKITENSSLWKNSIELSQEILKRHQQIVVIGFGGSAMGARCLVEASHQQDKILFFDNMDMIENEHHLKKIKNLNSTAWIFISKSGTTIEVLALLEFLSQYLSEKKIPFWENTYYVTEQKSSSLYNISHEKKRPCLEIPLDVGGRFSVLSPAGMLIGSLCGLNLNLIKLGAQRAIQDKKNICDLSFQYLSSFEDHKNISLFWFYNSSMRWFGGWIQQLWAESLGKELNRNNQKAYAFSTPLFAIGSSDQHSILQQIIDGPRDKFITFFRFQNIEDYSYNLKNNLFEETRILNHKNLGQLISAQAQGTQDALKKKGIPCQTLLFENFKEESMGYLFMLFQIIVSVLAEYHHINAFDQPGVELGKVKTREKLSH